MKVVEYRGKMYRVPDWARFIATDNDGEVWAYSKAPREREKLGGWDCLGGIRQQLFDDIPDWRDSLVELPE